MHFCYGSSKYSTGRPHPACSETRPARRDCPEDAIAAISPYLTEHINRFGDYTLNLSRKPPQPDYGFTLKQTAFAR
jgi:hypothetical protein